jgi:hypothetical protein
METIYVLKDITVKNKNKYIGLDKPSGGYPYLTDLINCNRFYNIKSVNTYKEMFDKESWVIEKFIYYTEPM